MISRGGGGGPHIPPLDLHMRFHNLFFLFQKETLAVASSKGHTFRECDVITVLIYSL